MGAETGINLATVGTAELKAMSVPVFRASLEQMSGEAIARFRKMRKLSNDHRQTLEKYLIEHPEKRPSGDDEPAPLPKKSGKAAKSAQPSSKHMKAAATGPSRLSIFKLRLRAWWEGVNVGDLPRLDAARASGKKPEKIEPALSPAPVAAPMAAPVSAPPPLSPIEERIDIIQSIWGEGFSLPGGDGFFPGLLRNISLPAGSPCLDVAPGLGGSMRAVAKALNLTIEGLEGEPIFAVAGGMISDRLGMLAQTPIRSGNPETETLGDKCYGAIFAREALFSFRDRRKFLASAMRALVDGGALLITDFILSDRAKCEVVDAWRAAEPRKPTPCTLEEYSELLAHLRFEVKSTDDLTAEYVALIQAGWKKLHAHLKNAKIQPEKAAMLMEEADLWMARCRALESGRLKLIFIHARMHHGPKRALNDPMTID
ncbi:methyltransferase domain-containing protein [Parvibaculum sedimenti]|uniref:Methyltransferase domain-containing protein n=1 Tax=Parvibaculum sedimenti TaxID=2608632 RepID=A0A6N6VF97_9HYPH|nr:methyltransferase domain-containing protein [Parvibaculum sedimenti]KAB7738544.1 methyltransferase domain-containing protein [Parvibaculum sedimenti]